MTHLRNFSKTARTRQQTGAFSLIEIMLSMTIILIVVGMAAMGIVPALRKATIERAAQDIVNCADMARQLAMMDNGVSGNATFGVRLSVDDAGIGTVQVVQLSGSSVEVYQVNGTPYKEVRFPSSVILSKATTDMVASEPIIWFYQPVIGDVRKQDGSRLSGYTVSVGMFVSGMGNVRDVQRTTETGNLDLAPAVAENSNVKPGLVVRDPQNRYSQAITILNSGMAFATDCSQ